MVKCGTQIPDEPQTQSPISSDDDDSESDDDPFDPRMQLDEHLSSLKHTIDNLYKLSFLIRNRKSKQSAALKAESYKKLTEQRADVFELYEHHDRERAYNFVQQARVENDCRKNPGSTRKTSHCLGYFVKQVLSAGGNLLTGRRIARSLPVIILL